MRIEATSAETFGQTDGRAPHDAGAPATEPRPESRALVVIAPPAPKAHKPDRPMAYRDAPFMAQLIATKAQMPQTRSRRRAEPQDALAAYRAVAALAR
jgi:hypothetical protein